MAEKETRETRKLRRARLFGELLGNMNQQLDIDRKIKEAMENLESLYVNAPGGRITARMQAKAMEIRDLYIEAESLQGEGRAIFHRLFGTDFED